jgi:hypothetical protein
MIDPYRWSWEVLSLPEAKDIISPIWTDDTTNDWRDFVSQDLREMWGCLLPEVKAAVWVTANKRLQSIASSSLSAV